MACSMTTCREWIAWLACSCSAGKRVLLGGLGGLAGDGVGLLQILAARVGEHLDAGVDTHLALFEKEKGVPRSRNTWAFDV